jgi:hypothetical protein
MNIITCPECGSKFDASSFEPGERVDCINCRFEFIVPRDSIETLKPVATPRKRPEGWGKPKTAAPKAPPAPKLGRGRGAPAAPSRPTAPSRSTAPARPAATARPAAPGRGKQAPAGRSPARAAPPTGGRSAARSADTRRPAARSREETPARRRGREPAAKSASNTPMFLGLGGIGLALIIVVFIFVMRPNGDEGETKPAPKAKAVKTAAQNPVNPNDPSNWGFAKKLSYWNNTLVLRAIDVAKSKAVDIWKSNHAWAVEHTMPQQAKAAMDKVLKLDPQDAWANEKRGYKLFTYKNYEIDEMYEWERKKEIMAFVDEHDGKAWVSTETYKLLGELQTEEGKHIERIAADPLYRWTKHWIQSTRLDPAYGLYKFSVNEEFPPYLVFVQDTGKEADKKEVDRLVRRNGLIFQELKNSWKTKVEPEIRKVSGYEDFRLPELGLSDPKDPNPPVLKIWVFFNEKDFRDYQNRVIGRPLPPGARAYYRRDNQWVTLFEGGGFEKQWYGRQTFNTGKTFHEGAHQIIHYYTKLIKDRQLAKLGKPKSGFLDMSWRSHWFTEGVPELFGAADETKPDQAWETFAPYHSRIHEYKRALTPARKKRNLYWTLNELVRISNGGTLGRAASEKTTNPNFQGVLSSLFYAEAWTFCHFLWNAEGGKYRQYFVRYAIKELHGESGFNVFKEIFEPICPGGDCSKLEPKVIEYLNKFSPPGPSSSRPR